MLARRNTFRHVYTNIAAREGAAALTYAEVCDPSIHNEIEDHGKRDAGWNEERACREPVLSAIGGCKPVIIRRLPGRAPFTMVKIKKSM